MQSSDLLQDFVVNNLSRLPVFLICLAGFVLAALTLRKHPLASILTLAALAVMIVNNIASTAVMMLIAHSDTIDASSKGAAFQISGLVFGLMHALALTALIAAVFVGRARK